MKNIILILLLIFISGCSKIKLGELDSGIKYSLSTPKSNPNEISIHGYSHDKNGNKIQLKDLLNLGAKKVKSLNKNYFVLIGSGTSNLNGFPINTYSELKRYINLHKNNKKFSTTGSNLGLGKNQLRTTLGSIELHILAVGDEYKNSFISVWDVEKTIADTE